MPLNSLVDLPTLSSAEIHFCSLYIQPDAGATANLAEHQEAGGGGEGGEGGGRRLGGGIWWWRTGARDY